MYDSPTLSFSAANFVESQASEMASKAGMKTTFEPEKTIQPFYTGGSVALDTTGRILTTCLGEDAIVTDLNTGEQLARVEGVCPVVMLRIEWVADAVGLGWREYHHSCS